VRLFLAVELDDRARLAVAAAIRQAQTAAGDAAAALRWSVPENVHLTLHFIGAFDPGRVPALTEALGDTVPVAPFDVSLGRLGAFPPRGALRTLWIAIDDGRDSLMRLHHELGNRLARAGVAIEPRPLTPHLTLARARDRERRRSTFARAMVDRLSGLDVLGATPARWRVSHVALMNSDLSGPRPRYESIKIIRCQ